MVADVCQHAQAPAADTYCLPTTLAPGLDVLGPLLCKHVHLQDLQAIKNTSKQLRAWIPSLPETTWHAVAARTLPAYHPALWHGDVRAYFAWQAARDKRFAAALAGGASAWPHSTYPCPPIRLCQPGDTFVSVLSHDCQTMALAQRDGEIQLILRQLQTGSEHILRPPTGYSLPIEDLMVFSPDDSYLAVILWGQGNSTYGDRLLLASNPRDPTCSRAWRCVVLESGWPDSLEWAGNSRMLCLTVGHYAYSHFWVWDEQLTLVTHFEARFQGIHDAFWNASFTGMLVQCLPSELTVPAGRATAWQYSGLRGQPGAVLGQECWFGHMHWGAWLPGTGEVLLAARKHGPLTRLNCCVIEDEPQHSSTGLVVLGSLLRVPDLALWTASMRHVAVVTTNPAGTLLQLFVLESGPRLRLLHSLDMGGKVAQAEFSPDGRYLLLSELAPDCAEVNGWGCITRPVLVQVSSGSKVAVSDQLRHWVSWTPAGISRPADREHQMLLDFPSSPRRVQACTTQGPFAHSQAPGVHQGFAQPLA